MAKYRTLGKIGIIGLGFYLLLSCPGNVKKYDTYSVSDPYKAKKIEKKITKSMSSLRVSDGD